MLYLAIKALEFNEGDEIIVPAYTFSAVPLIIQLSGLKPVFVDVDKETYNIDVSLIERKITQKTKAILITHMFGQPCKMDVILNLAKNNNLKLIEDCAHACGAKYKGQRAGSFGDAAIFSFKIGKNMPCFGGGMVTSNRSSIYEKIKRMIEQYPHPTALGLFKNIAITYFIHFITKKRIFPYTMYPAIIFLNLFHFDLIDTILEERSDAASAMISLRNQTKFTELQASVGLRQLARLDGVNQALRRNAQLLTEELNKIKNISTPFIIPEAEPTFLYYRIRVKDAPDFRKKLLKMGIDTKRDDMSACPYLDAFKGYETEYQVSKELAGSSIEIPNSPYLNQKDIAYIAKCIRSVSRQTE